MSGKANTPICHAETFSAEHPRTSVPLWRRAWERWKRIAEAIGNFNARVLLTVFYLVLVAPVALGLKLLSDPLKLRRNASGYWSRPAAHEDGVEAAKRQFS